jgi:hypothetical protein
MGTSAQMRPNVPLTVRRRTCALLGTIAILASAWQTAPTNLPSPSVVGRSAGQKSSWDNFPARGKDALDGSRGAAGFGLEMTWIGGAAAPNFWFLPALGVRE